MKFLYLFLFLSLCFSSYGQLTTVMYDKNTKQVSPPNLLMNSLTNKTLVAPTLDGEAWGSSLVAVGGTNANWYINAKTNILLVLTNLMQDVDYRVLAELTNTSIITISNVTSMVSHSGSTPAFTTNKSILTFRVDSRTGYTNVIDTSGQLLTLAEGINIGFDTNASVMSIKLKSVIVNTVVSNTVATNGIGLAVTRTLGVGGATTNFTVDARGPEVVYMDGGTTNVNIVAIMNYSEVVQYKPTLIITNRTSTSRTLSFGATTNNWICLQEYDGLSGPVTITNATAVWVSTSILGTNVYYAVKHMPNPTN